VDSLGVDEELMILAGSIADAADGGDAAQGDAKGGAGGRRTAVVWTEAGGRLSAIGTGPGLPLGDVRLAGDRKEGDRLGCDDGLVHGFLLGSWNSVCRPRRTSRRQPSSLSLGVC